MPYRRTDNVIRKQAARHSAIIESARLIVFEGEGHTAYNRGSDCVDDAVDGYLIDLEPPDDDTRC